MQISSLDPDVADLAPTDADLTSYDELHMVTYWRLLDAEADRADWQEVARIVLHIDPERDPLALEMHMTVIWREQNGWQTTATAICSAAALPNRTNLPCGIRKREQTSSPEAVMSCMHHVMHNRQVAPQPGVL